MKPRKSPIIKADLQKAAMVSEISKGARSLRGTNEYKGSVCKHRTLHDAFHIFYSDGRYCDEESPISYKTLERHYKKLVEEGILEERNGLCYLNLEKILDFGKLDKEQQEVIKFTLLENEDYESYRILRDRDDEGKYYCDEELDILKRCVKNRYIRFKNNKENIAWINSAIAKREEIEVIYKGEMQSVFPLCYVINRRGTNCYLISCAKRRRKMKLCNPMDVEGISVPILKKRQDGREKRTIEEGTAETFLELVKNHWDVGQSGESEEVILKIRKDAEGQDALKELTESGWNCTDSSEYYIVSGQVYGLSDFSAWIRGYVNSCFVIKPEHLKKQMITALETKIERYEEVDV